MYLPPIYHMIEICVTRALRYLINSFACVILNNKFTPRSSELKFQYCNTRYFTQAVVTDKFIATRNYSGICFDYREIYLLNNVRTHVLYYSQDKWLSFLDCSS